MVSSVGQTAYASRRVMNLTWDNQKANADLTPTDRRASVAVSACRLKREACITITYGIQCWQWRRMQLGDAPWFPLVRASKLEWQVLRPNQSRVRVGSFSGYCALYVTPLNKEEGQLRQ